MTSSIKLGVRSKGRTAKFMGRRSTQEAVGVCIRGVARAAPAPAGSVRLLMRACTLHARPVLSFPHLHLATSIRWPREAVRSCIRSDRLMGSWALMADQIFSSGHRLWGHQIFSGSHPVVAAWPYPYHTRGRTRTTRPCTRTRTTLVAVPALYLYQD